MLLYCGSSQSCLAYACLCVRCCAHMFVCNEALRGARCGYRSGDGQAASGHPPGRARAVRVAQPRGGLGDGWRGAGGPARRQARGEAGGDGGGRREVSVRSAPRYVSRGGIKLENALARTGLAVRGGVALDVGASTGGLHGLSAPARRRQVVAVDVGYGELALPPAHRSARARAGAHQRPRARRLRCFPYVPDLAVVDVSFISLTKVLPAVLGCLAAPYDVLALVKPQFEVRRARVGKGGVVRDPGPAVRRSWRSGAPSGARELPAAGRARLPLLWPARPQGQPRDLHLAGRARARGGAQAGGASAGRAGMARRGRAVTDSGGRRIRDLIRWQRCPMSVLTHRRVEETRAALGALIERGRDRGDAALRRRRRPLKHGLRAEPGVEVNAEIGAAMPSSCASCSAATARSCARCSSMRAARCRCSRSTSARSAFSRPSSRRRSRMASRARSAATSSCCACPAIVLETTLRRGDGDQRCRDPPQRRRARGGAGVCARRRGGRLACAAMGWCSPRPPGSTGYNLANGGPVMAWGVEGFVVSFIAPHSLTARALVVAPSDPTHDPQSLARGVGRLGRRAPRLRAGPRRAHRRALRRRRRHDRAAAGLLLLSPSAREVRPTGALRPTAPTSRAHASGRAADAYSRWRSGGAATARHACSPVRCSEAMKPSSCSREKRRCPPGRAVAVRCPASAQRRIGRQRDAQIARGL